MSRCRYPGDRTAFMCMPKAAVDEDNCTVASEHDVRTTRKVPGVKAEATPGSMEGAADQHLGLSVLAPEPGHQRAPLFWIENRHWLEMR